MPCVHVYEIKVMIPLEFSAFRRIVAADSRHVETAQPLEGLFHAFILHILPPFALVGVVIQLLHAWDMHTQMLRCQLHSRPRGAIWSCAMPPRGRFGCDVGEGFITDGVVGFVAGVKEHSPPTDQRAGTLWRAASL